MLKAGVQRGDHDDTPAIRREMADECAQQFFGAAQNHERQREQQAGSVVGLDATPQVRHRHHVALVRRHTRGLSHRERIEHVGVQPPHHFSLHIHRHRLLAQAGTVASVKQHRIARQIDHTGAEGREPDPEPPVLMDLALRPTVLIAARLLPKRAAKHRRGDHVIGVQHARQVRQPQDRNDIVLIAEMAQRGRNQIVAAAFEQKHRLFDVSRLQLVIGVQAANVPAAGMTDAEVPIFADAP